MTDKHTKEDEMSKTRINITRKAGNVRMGSRAWAAQLAGNWTYEVCRYGDCEDHICVKVGDLTVAVLDCDRDTDTSVAGSAERGGLWIGDALMSDLNAWADEVDLSVDDACKLAIAVTS